MKEISEHLQKVAKGGCAICGGEAVAICAHELDNPGWFGVQPGHVLHFAICKKCVSGPPIDTEKIEYQALQDLQCGFPVDQIKTR